MKLDSSKNPRRQIIGLHNRSAGKQFEALIEIANNYYELYDIAVVGKTPEPVKVLKPLEEGRFVCCFAKKAEPDYKGTVAGGRCICFEAKNTFKDRITQDEVTDEQARILTKYARMNADCYVLVSFGFVAFYRIPWGVWRNMKKIYGHKYLTPEEISPYQVKFKNGILDYLYKAGSAPTNIKVPLSKEVKK